VEKKNVNKMKKNSVIYFIFIISTFSRLFGQEAQAKLYFYEKQLEPIKLARVEFYNDAKVMVGVTTSDMVGNFLIKDTSEIYLIKIIHPLTGLALIYEEKYNSLVWQDSSLIFKMNAFDYTQTKRGEAFFYENVLDFLDQKNSKVLYLSSKRLIVIPKYRQICKHGVSGLFLNNNNLTTLPHKIFKSKGLVYMDLSGNNLDKKSIDLIEKWKKKGIMIIY
jgi:hypothetical protein